jgi:hypothetical protein
MKRNLWRTLAVCASTAMAVPLATAGVSHAATPGRHTVTAVYHTTSTRNGTLVITDPSAGQPLDDASYTLKDGYTKFITFPTHPSVLAVDIANCGYVPGSVQRGHPIGTGITCPPRLHDTEVVYGDTGGTVAGREKPRKTQSITEVAKGAGNYLTVGHIDHGAGVSIEYCWADGEMTTIKLNGNVLITRVLFHSGPTRSAQVITP